MKSIKDIEILRDLCKEYNIQLPKNLQTPEIYKKIEIFKDAEYIYCIAYEMLIRTDEYNKLLKEYEPLKNKSKNDMTTEEFSKLRELINRMNKLGLKKTSFLGFDCGNDDEHVFKKIEHYDEIINSPWTVRMIHKFQIDPSLGFNSLYHMLIDFYYKKNELYVLEFEKYKKISLHQQETSESAQINFVNNIHITEIKKLLDHLYIPHQIDNQTKYKALKDIIYLKELDSDFLALLKEKKNSDLLIQTKSDYSYYNIDFWNKYCVNDIRDGLAKLIEFHIDNNLIYDKNHKQIVVSKNKILENPSNFYIPCVNRLNDPVGYRWEKENNTIANDEFIKKLKFNGLEAIVGDKGFIKIMQEDNIYFIQINENISLGLLEDSFLETLTYEDLKNIYINTEPIFSRPRLMFDEARLTNIPINLNLSKEDLLLYIAQIKTDYDKNKNIVRTDIEYFFDLTLESDLTEMPTNIKYAHEKREGKDKRFLPKKREEFKESFASAFYIYDLYKFFIRFFELKKKCIRHNRRLKIAEIKRIAKREGDNINQSAIDNAKEGAEREIKNYENNNLITQISYLIDSVSEEQIKYYLTTMKEFIHGVNRDGENNPLKREFNIETKKTLSKNEIKPTNQTESLEPKYKNLIIGNSYIIKSNDQDLKNILIKDYN